MKTFLKVKNKYNKLDNTTTISLSHINTHTRKYTLNQLAIKKNKELRKYWKNCV